MRNARDLVFEAGLWKLRQPARLPVICDQQPELPA